MRRKPSIEELIIDDTFINYCFQNNIEDYNYWEDYLKKFPSEKSEVEEARQTVIGLHLMLQTKHATRNVGSEDNSSDRRSRPFREKAMKIVRYAVSIAAVLTIVLFISKLMNDKPRKLHSESAMEVNKISVKNNMLIYQTRNGERKFLLLSDSTKVWLNVDTELKIDTNYGMNDRRVYLKGEALFDVVHNQKAPFIVSTAGYDVEDLGTLFNVKAYPKDKAGETSLIRGAVQISVKGKRAKIRLVPNQKVVINNDAEGDSANSVREKKTGIALLPLTYNHADSILIETAWTKNRLEINNEDFYQMQEKLERWYDVNITVTNDQVGRYPFTATFEKEDIRQVLQALQYAYPFNYKIENNEVIISK